MTYKVAVEVGSLGDNISYLRHQIATDEILQILTRFRTKFDTISAHTRWASAGAITEPNCHPVDNTTVGCFSEKNGIIHTCLNGDIDNFQELKIELEHSGKIIPPQITTDTKIIPLQIQKYIKQDYGIQEAFRLAVNDFAGSHAISMHTDLAPGKMFLAQRGSGQAIFVGLADEHYMPISEVYGFIEETAHYLKLDGEAIADCSRGQSQGQIFILDQASSGGLDGIQAMYYDGMPMVISEKDIKHTEITSRDIDRQEFSHYFLKEISESPTSVEKTLQNRWKIKDGGNDQHVIMLDQAIIPKSLQQALGSGDIKRIFFIGQGTAGVAALACANILNYYLDNPAMLIAALKASEFSGYQPNEHDEANSMADALVIAISQSGTTTDTNRTVDMVKERGAYTLAIVNRRDSDLTFKVDGVMYTSSGRDIEMSVASTKAFYSQIVAGAILGLYIARLKNRRNDEFVSAEIKQLLALPSQMRKVLALGDQIAKSAQKLAVTKTYWAAVGSGPNKASADEIRIKLSELCYKTISSDFVEDKKHIDLSSEPLIVVCAAGTRSTVIGDIIFEIDFSQKGTPSNMLDTLFQCLAESINYLARPVDAIKHQAKTVTVGTSRISDRIEGILFGAIALENFNTSQLTNSNIIVLKNLQGIISGIDGSVLYQISGLNLLGEPVDDTTIEIKDKRGIAAQILSRIETDKRLKGSKRIIVRQGNVYIGKGRKDDRSILVIPILSSSPSTPNIIEYLLLLHISFKENVSLPTKIKALGGKYENIKHIVQENSMTWEDYFLEFLDIQELFGLSAEKIGEYIISRINHQKQYRYG